MVRMIIKGLFRRYERWNPVHPTSGAFWGMGVGIGCGVGWGPGFGPEVIGYVGAGCGIGFSVGITLAGFGVGLPANALTDPPLKALIATSNHAWELMQSSNLLSVISNTRQERNNNDIPPKSLSLQRKMNESSISSCSKYISDSFRSFRNQFSDPRKDIKD